MILREGMALVGIGLVIGMTAAFGTTRMLTGLLYGVQPRDASTYLLALAAVVTVTLIACLLPARRATAVDPIRTLRAT